ncbi:MAG: AAA family ATPase [Gammaproteobacteria bacterium]|nr:AAA family ATPase [Gammaproteobacteria bacterium]
MTETKQATVLPAKALRWECDPQSLGFRSTAEIDSPPEVVGQSTAYEALKFGLQCHAKGQNVYVRGVSGTGRMTLVRRLLDELKPKCEFKYDRCYVHNFTRLDRPRLISLPAGQARAFRRRMRELTEFIGDGLPKALDAEPIKSQRSAIQEKIKERVSEITAPLEADLQKAEMAMVALQSGPVAQTAIFPLVDGQPMPPDQFDQLVMQGKVSAKRKEQFLKDLPAFQQRLHEISKTVTEAYQTGSDELRTLNENAARDLLRRLADPIIERFPQDTVSMFLQEVVQDVVDNRLRGSAELPDPETRYGINVVLEHDSDDRSPVVEESTPNLVNLLGTVEPEWVAQGPPQADYRGVRAGALLRADGGYLILNVKDVLTEPGAWRALIRTLRTGRLEIVPAEVGWLRSYLSLQPEPIEISVRVILVGDATMYYQLDSLDPDFSELFKVLADLDHEIDRDADGVKQYAAVISQIVREESLPHFKSDAVAALAEHGARIAAKAGKLTARFGRIADIAREAAFLANQASADMVSSEHVVNSVQRTKYRASLPSRKFQQLVNSGTIKVETQGEVVGQINGLAVISSGPVVYGFPARITATIGAGSAGLISIEGRAAMSGAIHTKGFHILGGLLRHLLRTDHPLAFSASLAFEQSYGGIDGDSASGAEVCCLLSALTDMPISQSLAMTGAIDQHGHIQAIGGANEKIEGFFDACKFLGLTGDQGTIIPASNAGDLMLRHDVVEACESDKFHVFAVETVHQALQLLTGVAAGEHDGSEYPEGTLLRCAVDRAGEFWRKTMQSPAKLTSVERDGEAESDQNHAQ